MNRLLVLHGALGCASQLEGLKKVLSENFECQTFDFIGHGGKAELGAFHMQELADQIGTELDSMAWDDCYVFGYSMGGYAALVHAADNPGRIKRIYTLGTKFDWNPEGARKEATMLDPEKIEAKVPAFAKALSQRHGDRYWKNLLENTANMMQNLGSNHLLDEEKLSGLHIPVRIGRGEMDRMVSRSESMQAASDLPLAAYCEWALCQHPIEQVSNQEILESISPFFH
jgi:pimeloyl-ACP methyl ester carboxylesterase